MPKFSYKCPSCSTVFSLTLSKREAKVKCSCGSSADNIFRVEGGVSIMEKLDNGLMARAVVRLHNIEEIVAERADREERAALETE
jgi:hypothetical protein